MMLVTYLILLALSKSIHGQSWNTTDGTVPWELYLQLGDIQRPLGLTLDHSSLAHHHFYIGYLCLQSFMYDEAQRAFDLALSVDNTLIEAYIGKMLGYKQTLWDYTDFTAGQATYNATQMMLNTSNVTLSKFQSSLFITVYQWYTNASDLAAGEWVFLTSIANLSQTYPNETDIRVLWGLSLLNVANQAQFDTEMEPQTMIQSRAVFKTALQYEPNHPGALHYLIHAYDLTQVNISAQAADYASLYGKIATTASHGQHMPAHIWLRVGSWVRTVSADSSAIISSFSLCATEILGRQISISSTQLESVLTLFNTSNQTSLLLECDKENRAHSMEWLSYTRLQTGDWSDSIALLGDFFIANNRSTITPNHYFQFAYRTQARAIIELFFWFPYHNQFQNRTEQILALNVTQIFIPIGINSTRWYPIWSEAALRFSECLRLVTANNMSNNTSIVEDHLNQMAILSSRANPVNEYISASISMMISHLRGIRSYVNQSWQECLNELDNATQYEATLVAGATTPTLLFIHSPELLAMHLLLIYTKLNERNLLSTYTLNGTNVSVDEFPTRALALYQQANSSAPNRAINTLGMAHANLQMGNKNEAIRLYQLLLTQMTSSNNADPIFSGEALNIIATYSAAASTAQYSFLFSVLILCILNE